MKEIKKIVIINLILLALCVLGLVICSKFSEAASFLVGVLIAMVNFSGLVFISTRLVKGGSIFMSAAVVLSKFAFLFGSIYFVTRIKSISLPYLVFGLMILVPSILIYCILLMKNQMGVKKGKDS